MERGQVSLRPLKMLHLPKPVSMICIPIIWCCERHVALTWWLAKRAVSAAGGAFSACSAMAIKPAVKKPKLSVADGLIRLIPPPPHYDPLPYRHLLRAGTTQLPVDLPTKSYGDPYSLFTLFLTEKHFNTITKNINYYAKTRNAGGPNKRPWWPNSASEVKVFIEIFS